MSMSILSFETLPKPFSLCFGAWPKRAAMLTLLLSAPALASANPNSTFDLQSKNMQENILVASDAATSQAAVKNLQRDQRGRWRLAREGNGYLGSGELVTAPHDLGKSGRRVSVDWIEQWTAPLRYEKYAGNPVYGPDKSGAWDTWTNGVSIVPTDGDKKYRMYYTDYHNGIGFAEADVSDPTKWQEHPASPVLVPRKDNWEGGKFSQPRVVKVSETHWRIYYTGWGFPGPGLPKAPGTSWALGLAESFDGGTTWRRYQDAPILERGTPDSPDGGAAVVPMVVRVGDKWMMWYTAARGLEENAKDVHLCLAASLDGMQWEKYADNPVLSDKPDNGPHAFSSRCYVRHDNGVFRMWYSYSTGVPSYRIRYAESTDGINWERAPLVPVLDVSPARAWDDVRVEYPEVQVVDGLFCLWFCGNSFGSVGYATGINETGVRLWLRSGDSARPDAGWTSWRKIERHQPLTVKRYMQVRAELWSKNPALSPALNEVKLYSSKE